MHVATLGVACHCIGCLGVLCVGGTTDVASRGCLGFFWCGLSWPSEASLVMYLAWLDVACRVVARIGLALFGVTWVIGWRGIASLLVSNVGVF